MASVSDVQFGTGMSASDLSLRSFSSFAGGITSAWRSEHALQGYLDTGRELQFDVVGGETEGWLAGASSVAFHSSESRIAVGGETSDGTPVVRTAKVALSEDRQPSTEMESVAVLSAKCAALKWTDTGLYCGAADGSVVVLRPVPASTSGALSVSETLRAPSRRPSSLSSSSRSSAVVPGTWPPSTRINALDVIGERTIATWNQRVLIWDQSTMRADLRVSTGPLWAAALHPWREPLCAVAGVTQSLKILDFRAADSEESDGTTRAVVWKKSAAHSAPIRSIAWCPLAPLWIATASEDATVSVWDMRFGSAPVVRCADHWGAVMSVTWSPQHAHVVASTGADATLRLLDVRATPYTLAMTAVELFGTSVVDCDFSHTDHLVLAGADRAGTVAVLAPGEAFSKALRPRGAECASAAAQCDAEVDTLIFNGDIPKASAKLRAVARAALDEDNAARASAALAAMEPLDEAEVTFPRDGVAPAGAAAFSEVPYSTLMARAAASWSGRAPPSLVKRPEDAAVRENAVLQQRLRALAASHAESFEDIAAVDDTLDEVFASETNVELLQRVVALLAPHRRVRAAELAAVAACAAEERGDPAATVLAAATPLLRKPPTEQHDERARAVGDGNERDETANPEPVHDANAALVDAINSAQDARDLVERFAAATAAAEAKRWHEVLETLWPPGERERGASPIAHGAAALVLEALRHGELWTEALNLREVMMKQYGSDAAPLREVTLLLRDEGAQGLVREVDRAATLSRRGDDDGARRLEEAIAAIVRLLAATPPSNDLLDRLHDALYRARIALRAAWDSAPREERAEIAARAAALAVTVRDAASAGGTAAPQHHELCGMLANYAPRD